MSGEGVEIDLGAPSDEQDPATGLLSLVVAVMEILIKTMEREAVRRMESGHLTDQEIERLGAALQSLDAEVSRIKEREGIANEVDRLQADLDGIVQRAVERQPVGEGDGTKRPDDKPVPEAGDGS